ncbi:MULTISPECIES: hypothetical protein, partial [Spirulina sp. CCY15215]|uniref:hypothetical protein n=1 Tax=Spirulina sp. CCY15215 TaxID=2767591 RepID=UPI001950A7DC
DSLCSDSLVCGNSSPANPIGSNGSPLATSLMENLQHFFTRIKTRDRRKRTFTAFETRFLKRDRS